jgi:hypothetical protein
MARDRQRRGRGWGWLVGLIVVLALLWIGYWFAAHYAAEKAIARLIAPHGQAQITCGTTDISGFPLRLDVRCDSPAYAEGTAVNASIGTVHASAPLYRPGSVAADIDGPLLVNAPGNGVGLTVTWTSAKATANAGLGGIDGAGATFTTFHAENTGPLPKLGIVAASAETADGGFASAGGGSYRITADASHLALTDASRTLPPIDLTLDATANKVGDLSFRPEPAILAWLRGTPSITLTNLRLAMAGASVTASGNLSLSSEGKLNGTLLLQYNSSEALADLIETLKPGTRDKYAPAIQALGVMSKPVTTPDGQALQTTVSFLDGIVFLTILPLPIDPIPPVRF